MHGKVTQYTHNQSPNLTVASLYLVINPGNDTLERPCAEAGAVCESVIEEQLPLYIWGRGEWES